MFRWLFLALLLIPAMELYVLISVGSMIGALPTIFITVMTALMGAWLMRFQGIMTLQKLQLQLLSGETPSRTLVEGALIVLGGMLLLIPGFITDVLGFTLLNEPVRAWLAGRFIASRRREDPRSFDRQGHIIIDTEAEEVSSSRSLPEDRRRF